MNKVYVNFKDSKYNYCTSINPQSTNKELKKYFVGTKLTFKEDLRQECISIELIKSDNDVYVDRYYPDENNQAHWKYIVIDNGEIARGWSGWRRDTELYFMTYEQADVVCQARIRVAQENKKFLNLK